MYTAILMLATVGGSDSVGQCNARAGCSAQRAACTQQYQLVPVQNAGCSSRASGCNARVGIIGRGNGCSARSGVLGLGILGGNGILGNRRGTVVVVQQQQPALPPPPPKQ